MYVTAGKDCQRRTLSSVYGLKISDKEEIVVREFLSFPYEELVKEF